MTGSTVSAPSFFFTLTEQVRERLLYVCKMTFIIGEKKLTAIFNNRYFNRCGTDVDS